MTFQTDPFRPIHIEPLPAEFEAEAVEIDALAGRVTASEAVPAGLADRVYHASVNLLPGAALPLVATTGRPARFTAVTWLQRRSIVSRIALAASVGLAFLLASQINVTPTNPAIDSAQPEVLVASIKPLSPAEQWLLVDRVNDMTLNGGYKLVEFETPRPTTIDGLVEVSALSLDQLASDMRNLEASLEEM